MLDVEKNIVWLPNLYLKYNNHLLKIPKDVYLSLKMRDLWFFHYILSKNQNILKQVDF